MAPKSSRRSNGIKMVLGLAVSLVCLWWAVRGMLKDPNAWPKIVSAFERANYASLPLILLILFIFYWMKAWRWRILLAPVGTYQPLRELLGPIMIGFAFNNVLPARIGELIRISVFSKQQKVPLTVAASSVVLERVFDGMAIVLYLAIGLLFVEGLDPRIQQGAIAFSAMACCIVIGALCYVIWTKPFVDLFEAILKRVPFLPHSITDKICRMLEQGAHGLSSLKDYRLVLAIVVLSLVKWALNGMLVLLSLWSFGLPHSVPIAMVLLGAIAFGVALPSSPGYIGVMQAVFMEVMKFFTTDNEAVFAASIYFQFTQWVPVTLTGMIFFVLSGLKLEQVEQPVPEGEPDSAVTTESS
ncbi:lysylphosphatidylglycerol synthase transmembrane domain-containing protein [Planctomicrobium piriforme]|uniref:Lysylphosphatidylglycerol synthase TM region n=1 Tax=Planctomicrobium piriforme TaxID=1576369 RepID=A0A1I3T1A1_9PLAN|nr:lysylphosphatidylglycerol synthase transmembrane domain-containing protein [Planctomicrobium piriforme]SFJ63327.1 hypothetical protein SAMN05421753_12621 [Planctomicrobium piriforme]